MKSQILIGLILLTPGNLLAASPGTTAANFLKIGIAPRAIAMGEAQVGLADDVYATYWNPAGLARLSVQEAGFVQNQYIENISEQYVAYALPHPSLGSFGGSITYLNTGKMDGYDATGQPQESVGASDTSFALTYARKFFEDRRQGTSWSLGFTGKYLHEQLDTVGAQAFAGDVGLLFTPGHRWSEWLDGWKAGLAIRNVGSSMTFDEEASPLPRSLNAGISYAGRWLGESMVWTLDGRQPNDGDRSFGTGIELRTLKFVMVRAGYTSEGDLGNGLRLGGGLRFKTVQIDYAYAGMDAFGAAHRIGLTLRFGKTPQDPQYIAERWYEKGQRDYQSKRYTEALVDFNRALQIDPSHPEALKMMKQTYEDIKTMVPE